MATVCPGDAESGESCWRLTDRGRCEIHRRAAERRRGPRPQYDAEHKRTSLELRTAWVDTHGLVCPGFLVPAHPVASIADLTADHLVPGVPSFGYQVTCRGCNTRRMNTMKRGADAAGTTQP